MKFAHSWKSYKKDTESFMSDKTMSNKQLQPKVDLEKGIGYGKLGPFLKLALNKGFNNKTGKAMCKLILVTH